MRRTLLAVLLIATLLLPTQAAAYNGLVLSRASVGDVSLIDQHGENVSLEGLSEDLLVVAFVFTHCPDACPVITHNLKAVQAELPEDSSATSVLCPSRWILCETRRSACARSPNTMGWTCPI